MKRYFSLETDTFDGDLAELLIEVENNKIIRQIEIIGSRILWSTLNAEADENYPFTDQPEIGAKEMETMIEIDAAEFETKWLEGGGPKPTRQLKADLLTLAQNGILDVIVHGANCQCVMGAGIAAQIKKRFPEAYAADLRTSKGYYK